MEIAQLLLDRGADPNGITFDERGPLLKPPLGEYFNANDDPDPAIVRLLLKYGARVILKVIKNILLRKNCYLIRITLLICFMFIYLFIYSLTIFNLKIHSHNLKIHLEYSNVSIDLIQRVKCSTLLSRILTH